MPTQNLWPSEVPQEEPSLPRTGRPIVVPRGEKTPFGKLLDERGIDPRNFGEALATAEERPDRVPTDLVNLWIYGRKQPGQVRQALIARLLGVSRHDLFPLPVQLPAPRSRRRPRPTGGSATLELVSERDAVEALAVAQLAPGQERLPEGVAELTPSIHYQALTRARRARDRARSTHRRAA